MRFAIVKWGEGDGITQAIREELDCLGHQSVDFLFNQSIPKQVDVVLTFAPYNRFIPIVAQHDYYAKADRPIFVHWSVENPPDTSIPWPIMKFIGNIRLGVDLLNDSDNRQLRNLGRKFPFSYINNHFQRFLHVGEYFYSYRKKWVDIFIDSSELYVKFWQSHGLPAYYVPWGIPRAWYADLRLDRDIGVLWMGRRRNKHRSMIIDTVQREMSNRGIPMLIVDGIEHPFIYGQERTTCLNRAKITLNIQTNKYINILPFRYVLAAANKSFVLAESTKLHTPEIVEGQHYISTNSKMFINKILYYLEHEEERNKITENAYDLTTSKLTLENSLKLIINRIEQYQK